MSTTFFIFFKFFLKSCKKPLFMGFFDDKFFYFFSKNAFFY